MQNASLLFITRDNDFFLSQRRGLKSCHAATHWPAGAISHAPYIMAKVRHSLFEKLLIKRKTDTAIRTNISWALIFTLM